MATTTVDLSKAPVTRDQDPISQGNDIRDIVTCQLNGTAMVFTSVTWTLVVSTKRGASSATLSKTSTTDWTTSGIRVVDATAGQITIFIAPADTTALSGRYYYEVVATFPSDHSLLPSAVRTLFNGSIVVNDDATS